MYPDAKPAKFKHLVKSRRPGAMNVHTLCGRMANWLQSTVSTEAEATCTRCLAESLSRSTTEAR